MITAEKLKIFKKYNGDADGFTRAGKKSEKELMDNQDWSLIDSVIQDLEMSKNGLCSNNFKNQITKKLNDQFDLEANELIQKGL